MEETRLPGSFFHPETLVELVRLRARVHPDKQNYTYLVDGEDEEIHLSNGELDRQSRAVAARLQAMGLEGERALLLFQPGFDFITAFFGCLYAGVVAVPVYPPRQNRSLFRIQAIEADAQAKVALTTADVFSRIQPNLDETPNLKAIDWICTDELEAGIERDWSAPPIHGDTLAFMQYTSGSTGTPRGVMLSHRNMLYNAALIYYAFEHTRSSKGVFWLPSYHDMGLIGGILQPLFANRLGVIMSPLAFLQRPIRWLKAISKYRASTSGGPNFAYDLCVQKTTPRQREGLDLSCWLNAANGAEPINPDTLDAFCEAFEPYGFRREAFYPCYGMAEATLLVTGGYRDRVPVVLSLDARELEQNRAVELPPSAPHARRVVGCGRQLGEVQTIIVDAETRQQLPDGRVGEIWVNGPSNAQGYWNRPEETEACFGARLADSNEGPFLRTGDLGFFQDGELFVTGRVKDLIIIRGRNYYPQDIEASAEAAHPALREGGNVAAFTVMREGSEKLIVVQEIERKHLDQAAAAASAMRRAISRDHELLADEIVLIRQNSIPKTSSGKIQRHACRRAYLDDTLTVVGRLPGDLSLVEETPEERQRIDAQTERGRKAAQRMEQDSAARARRDAGSTLALGDEAAAAAESPSKISRKHRSVDEITEIVLESVKSIARERAANVTLDSTFADVGMDSLERVELQAMLEDRFGGRMPEDVGPELNTMREVVDAVLTHLGDATRARKKLPLDQIPDEYYRFECMREYQELKDKIDLLEAAGLANPFFKAHERVTNDTTMIDGRDLINFSSYNYIGTSGDPKVSAAAQAAIDRFGTSVSASRMVSGEKTLHRELEQALADWLGTDDAVVFVGGHATNETVIGHLVGPPDLILHDALAHNSILQGCILSGARRRAFPHNDFESLERLLADLRGEYRRVLVAIEGVYSMDGDYPHLPEFIDVKKRHKALLLVDEAHSIGTMGDTGRGIGEHFEVDRADVDLWMGTMSKALGSCGGYIAGCKEVVQYLKYTAPGFVYSVGLSPPNAAAALASLKLLAEEPQRVHKLRDNAELFLTLARQAGLNTGHSQDSPVIPVILGNSLHCLQLSQALNARGINVQPILYPAVEESAARLRFFITSTHTDEQIRYTVQTVAEELRAIDTAYFSREKAEREVIL